MIVRMKIVVSVVLALTCVAAVAVARGGDSEKDYSALPGYVDFAGLGIFDDEESLVEVYLHEALLGMVAAMVGPSEPELGEMLRGLKLVRVQKFAVNEDQVDSVEAKIGEMAKKLESREWMRAVRVRDRGEQVYVYFKLATDKIEGITVMAIENWDTAMLVNVVGEIDPELVGKLGRKFNIDMLENSDQWMEEIESELQRERKNERKDKRDR